MKPLNVALCTIALTLPCMAGASDASMRANPAAVFCVENGGEHVIESTESGEVGYCVLPDGTKVDAWDHFRANWDKTPAGN